MTSCNHFTVLLVDDEIGICRELAIILEEEGYKVFVAHTGKEALEVLERESIDLLATDVYMPVMDGLDLIVYTKKHYPDLKVFAFSGGDRSESIRFSEDSILKSIEKYGGITLLKKPMRGKLFLDQVSDMLEH